MARRRGYIRSGQPPSGGCVLKHKTCEFSKLPNGQPPSGGCVLKLKLLYNFSGFNYPAAFGRLCVETLSGGVESALAMYQPPSGGCVLKLQDAVQIAGVIAPAAFGRLCIEATFALKRQIQPFSGGCVLK